MLLQQRRGVSSRRGPLLFGPGSALRRSVTRIGLASFAFVGSIAFALVGFLGRTEAASCTRGVSMNIVAHEDDDILFLSPGLLHDIQTDRCVRTIFITAGDAGQSASFWQSRETGVKAGYAYMASDGAPVWTESDAGIPAHPIPVFTLASHANISVAFMRLPDGSPNGFASTNYETLEKLWQNTISAIHAVDGSSSYTRADLISTLQSLMAAYQPDQVNTQDYLGWYGDGDHADHHTAAYLAEAANALYTTPHTFTGYAGYPTKNLTVNVFAADFDVKQRTFETYGQYDVRVCPDPADNPPCKNSYAQPWIPREYAVPYPGQILTQPTSTMTPVSAAASTQTPNWTPASTSTIAPSATPSMTASSTPTLTPGPTPTPGPPDLALSATASASSENVSTTQTADKAIDGVIDGYPRDYTREWATVGGLDGSWLKLTWSTPVTVSRIVLYDRPNLVDWITGGNIQFSDGSSVSVGALNNDGTGVTIDITPRTITGLQFNITAVAPTTHNIGLAEIQVFE